MIYTKEQKIRDIYIVVEESNMPMTQRDVCKALPEIHWKEVGAILLELVRSNRIQRVRSTTLPIGMYDLRPFVYYIEM